MVAIPETTSYSPEITRVETTDVALGGNLVNVPNKQFLEIANRFAWLKREVDILRGAIPFDFQNGRLSLSQTDPIPSEPPTGTVLYFVPYTGRLISLFFDGAWRAYKFPTLSVNFLGQTPNDNYDVFAYYNSVTEAVELEITEWVAVGRETPLSRLDGVLVRSNDTTRRYLGTVYYDGVLRDGPVNRWLWNYNNRVPALLRLVFTGQQNHTYDSTSPRIFNNDPSQSVQVVTGLADVIDLAVYAGAAERGAIGLGINFPQTAERGDVTFEQVTSDIAPVSLGGPMPVSLSPGFTEFHIVQFSTTGVAAQFEATSIQTAGIFAKVMR